MMHTPSRFPLFAAALVAVATAACDDEGPPRTPASASGELGQGRFVYRCDNSIADCNAEGDAQVFPDAVVMGGTFALEFLPENEKLTGITLEAAASDFLSRSPKGFTGLKPGFGTVLAKDSAGRVVDFRAIEIVKAHRLGVYEANATDRRPNAPAFIVTIEVAVGATRALRAIGRTSDGTALAGVIGYDWSTADSSVATIETFSTDAVTIKGRKAGSTKLVLEGGGRKEEIDLIVTQGATP